MRELIKVGRETVCSAPKNLNVGYVYIISDGRLATKIGMSKNPNKRIRDISTQSGRDIKKIHISCLHESFRETEAALHNHFRKKRILGEWFSILFDSAVEKLNSLSISPVSEDRLSELKSEAEEKDISEITKIFEPPRLLGLVEHYGPMIKSLIDINHIEAISDSQKALFRAYAHGFLSSIPRNDLDAVLRLSMGRIATGDFDYSIDYGSDSFLPIIESIA